MSPLVVASVLPPGRWFDVVIFDEASQIPPAQAVSAISRGPPGRRRRRRAAAAADQLLHRRLRRRGASATDDDALTEGFESVLDVLVRRAAGPPPDVALPLPRRAADRLRQRADVRRRRSSPSPAPARSRSLRLRVGRRARRRCSRAQEAIESTAAEVDRVVELVLEHARTRPDRVARRHRAGHHARRPDRGGRAPRRWPRRRTSADFFDDAAPERFFVKNLERVQGDERDAIILSIGYGKTPHGRVLHRFGPLNLEGGERRLNVAITRARRRMTVVSSFTAADLDPSRLKARGALMLRDFLAYAASGGNARGRGQGAVRARSVVPTSPDDGGQHGIGRR